MFIFNKQIFPILCVCFLYDKMSFNNWSADFFMKTLEAKGFFNFEIIS